MIDISEIPVVAEASVWKLDRRKSRGHVSPASIITSQNPYDKHFCFGYQNVKYIIGML